MKFDQPHVSIIILNWNGWQDTIECLESVLKSEHKNYHIILIDNFSQDGSVRKIKEWALKENNVKIETNFPQFVFPLADKPIQIFEIKINNNTPIGNSIKKHLPNKISSGSIVLVRNNENSGFAAGNNLGIKIANILFESPYLYLLNNDTVIESQTIARLIRYLHENPSIGAATSAIYYYSEPKKLANLGGKLTFWASRKYYTELKDSENLSVTFITGCALIVRNKIFKGLGLLSENFFFGEEDFEFSLRLRKNSVPIACVHNSRVYHKEASSSKKLYSNNLRKMFIHIFNRVVNMREYFSYPVWCIWRWLMMLYAFSWLIFKYRISFIKAIMFIKSIEKYSRIYYDARKITVEKIYQELEL